MVVCGGLVVVAFLPHLLGDFHLLARSVAVVYVGLFRLFVFADPFLLV